MCVRLAHRFQAFNVLLIKLIIKNIGLIFNCQSCPGDVLRSQDHNMKIEQLCKLEIGK